MIRFRLWAILTAAVLCCCIPFLPVHAESAPEISAKSCILMDAQTGQIVYSLHPDEKRPMASTTKIMTVLLTLESGNLDTPFTVDSTAIRVEGSSMGLREGDTVTKRALCIGMLLPSGNDAANAAAVAVSGNVQAFLDRMNERAQEIGMSHTFFASPSGLDAPGHGSSARDMALLAREALKNPEFAAICSQPSMSVSFGNPPSTRTLKNTNKLLTMDSRVIGVKTGFTDAAGRCLVSAATHEGRTLICVTLFDSNDWKDHTALYDYGFRLAEPCTLPLPTNLTIPVEGGERAAVPVYAKEPLSLTAWRGALPEYEEHVILPPFLYAPVTRDTVIGELIYTNGKAEIGRLPLYASEEIAYSEQEEAESAFDKIMHWIKRKLQRV